jgi:hypothetical protein
MADHFVIDGSNLATEGRTEPSLAQLREAVTAFRGEHPGSTVTVVVDASFEHRIDPSERPAFSRAEVANEVVSPPAGAVGRGDGFLLQIANRTEATVVSNDSFQEFHAEYDWLFEPGRLIGGKPVPGVGWIFSLRRPVRGIVSRKTTQRAKREERAAKEVRAAIAEATADALTSEGGGRRRRRGGRGKSAAPAAEPEAVNQPAPFLQFVIDHRLGTQVEGVVDAFASHGAFVVVDGVRCYVPLGAMGDPRPSRARDVLRRGETRAFVVQAVDAPRRGVELALPGFEKIAGAPSDETVQAEVKRNRPKKAAGKPKADAKKPDAKKPDAEKPEAEAKTAPKPVAPKAAAKKAAAPAKKAPQPAKKSSAPRKQAPPAKAAAAKATAKQAPAKAAAKAAKAASRQPAAPATAPAKAKAAAKAAAKKAPGKTAAKKASAPAKAVTKPAVRAAKAPAKAGAAKKSRANAKKTAATKTAKTTAAKKSTKKGTA